MHPWIMALPASLVLASAAIAQSAPIAAHTGPADDDSIRTLVARLDLAAYKSTIKGLTQFGDRRQGTERNRRAVDWIEAQLKSYGCNNTERIKYDFTAPPPRPSPSPGASPAGPTPAATPRPGAQ